MSLSGKDVAEIARLLDESRFTSLDLKVGDFKLRIRRDSGAGGGRWVADEDDQPEPETSPLAESPAPAAAPEATPESAASAGEMDVIAPLLGNYYAAPRPGEDPFVQVGDRVEPDTVVAIIEVMKLMNSVRAGVSGTVTAMLAENGSTIEKGQSIIRVKEG